MKEIEKRGLEHKFIHGGQHGEIMGKLIEVFGIREPDYYLQKRDQDVLTAFGGVRWFTSTMMNGIFNGNKIFKDKDSIVLVHGDAPPCLTGTLIAKMNGLKVGHVEAGLRTYDFLNPFPEEFVRVTTDKLADYMFAPSDFAENNLKKMSVKGEIINTKYNTVFETIELSVKMKRKINYPKEKYVVFTTHRFETIHSLKLMKKNLDVLEKVSKIHYVVMIMHNTTKEKLVRFNLMDRITEMDNVEIRSLQVYPDFMKLINKSEFVVTDGGGLQEETYYLNKPCLVLRKKTERSEGLNGNVVISKMKEDLIEDFLENYSSYSRKRKLKIKSCPSNKIVNFIEKEVLE